MLALLAAILTGLHKGFNCEAYHTDLRRTLHAVRSLIEGLQEASLLEGEALASEVTTLNRALRDLRGLSIDIPH